MVGLSRMKINCGISTCVYYQHKKLELKNLKTHFKRKHPNKEVRVKGLVRQGTTFVAEQDADVISDVSARNAPELPSHIYPDYIMEKNIYGLLQELRSSLGDAEQISKVDHVIKLLGVLLSRQKEKKAPEPMEDSSPSGSAENSSSSDTPSIRSMSELLRHYGNILEIDRASNLLFCNVCKNQEKSGVFTYQDFEAFNPYEPLDKRFCNLKKAILRHFMGLPHKIRLVQGLEEESLRIPKIKGPVVTLTWSYYTPVDDMAYEGMVDIICGTISCTVHRELLARGSHYFFKLFVDNHGRRFQLRSINSREFEYILEYLYYGRVSVPHCHIPAVMEAAKILVLNGLKVGAHCVDDEKGCNDGSQGAHKSTSDANKNATEGIPQEGTALSNDESRPSMDVQHKIKVELEDPSEASESSLEENRIVYQSNINTDISRKSQVGEEITVTTDDGCQKVINIKTENDRWLPDYASGVDHDQELEKNPWELCQVKIEEEESGENSSEDAHCSMGDNYAEELEKPMEEWDDASQSSFQNLPRREYLGATFATESPNIFVQRAEAYQNNALEHGNQFHAENISQEPYMDHEMPRNVGGYHAHRLPPIRSIQELCNVFEDLVYDEKRGLMTCKLCDFMSKGTKGTFEYDAINGTTYQGKIRPSEKFNKFKTSMINHIKGAAHNKCNRAFYLRKGRGKLISSYIYHVGYHLLKSSTRTREFRELLSINERSGWSTGNAHDTLEILTDLRKAFSHEIIQRVYNFCRISPCISWLSEIVSLPKYSHEIIAMVGIFPHAEEGLFQSCVLAVPHFRTYDSSSLAKGWSHIASKIQINCLNISAIGTDDVHLKGYAASEFSNRMRNEKTDHPFNIPLICDPDVFIDLAEESLKQTNWVENCNKSIARVSTFFSEKHTAEMVTESDYRILDLCSLDSTEWYHYSQMYYKRFLSNVGAYEARVVTNRTDETGPELTYFIEHEEELCNKAAILYNFYNVLAEAKLVLRNLQKFPWEKLSAYSALINKFEILLRSSSNGSLDHTQWDFPEIIEGLPANEVALVIESIQMVLKKLKSPSEDHVLGEEESLCSNHILLEKQKHIRVLGDLEMARNCNCAVTHINLILEAFDELKRSKLIPGSLDLEKEVVHEAMARLKSYKPDETADNEELYMFLCTSDDPRVKSYINIVSRIWLIHPTGSFLKNMSNRLQQIQKLRGETSPEDLAHELIILWNGPPITDCDHLVDVVGKKHPITVKKNTSLSLKRLKTRSYPLKSLYQ